MSKMKAIKIKGPMEQEQWEVFIQACSDGGLMVAGAYETSKGQVDNTITACACRREEGADCDMVSCDRRDKDLVFAVLRALKLHHRIKVRFQWVAGE